MTPPRTTSYLVELLPVALLPSGHAFDFFVWCAFALLVKTFTRKLWMLPIPKRFAFLLSWAVSVNGHGGTELLAVTIRYISTPSVFSSTTVSNTLRGYLLRWSPILGTKTTMRKFSRAAGIHTFLRRKIEAEKVALYYKSSLTAPSEDGFICIYCRALSRALAEAREPAFLSAPVAASHAARARRGPRGANHAAGRPVSDRIGRCGANGTSASTTEASIRYFTSCDRAARGMEPQGFSRSAPRNLRSGVGGNSHREIRDLCCASEAKR